MRNTNFNNYDLQINYKGVIIIKIDFLGRKEECMLKEILNEMIINSELSQTEIEEKCNVSKGYLSKVLKGTIIPDENKIRKIAKVCNGDIELAVTSLWFTKAPKEILVKIEKI